MYQFWLGSILFPITPSSMKMSIKNKNTTVSLASGGEVNLAAAAGLTDISFTAILPARTDYPFAVYAFQTHDVAYYLEQLESMKTSVKPVQFHIVRITDGGNEMHSTHMKVMVESYDILEDAEKYGFDTAVEIKLKQYVQYGTKIITLNNDNDTATEEKSRDSSTAPAKQKTVYAYTVQKGDTIRSIAKRIYNDESKWSNIYTLNASTIEEQAKRHGYTSSLLGMHLFPGTMLYIRYEVG